MTPRVVGVVADDVTGAGDTVVRFAEVGWTAHLLRDPTRLPAGPVTGPTVLALATGARAAGAAEAEAATAAAVHALTRLGADRLYVKIDSTVRGSVPAQVDGALNAWARTHPRTTGVVCPAYPEQGRTVVDGRVLVHGVPLATRADAADAVTPVLEDRMERLVPTAGSVQHADARDDADLDRVAAALDARGADGVGIGSAGLAGALARRWPVPRPGPSAAPGDRSGPVLLAAASRHPVTAAGLAALAERAADGTGVEVLAAPTEPGDPARVAAALGDAVAERLAVTRYGALVLVGGDGADAVLDRLGATAIAVDGALMPGVPVGTLVGGPAAGLRVATKSGGFGDADTLTRLVDRLTHRPASPEETT